MKFTDASVAALKLPKGRTDVVVFDDRRPGLGVRLRASAKTELINRTWVVQCRVNGRSQRHDLGPTTATGTKRARELADEIFAKVRHGIDPKAAKRAAHTAAAETFGFLSEIFLKAARGRMRPSSYDALSHHIEKNLKALSGEPVQAINRKAIGPILTRLEEKIGLVTANRARAALSVFFTWAMAEGYVENNPVIGTTKRKEDPRNRVLIKLDESGRPVDWSELIAVWNACAGDDEHSRIVRLLILTGQRRDEVGGISESELRRDMQSWIIPKARTKNGSRKGAVDHFVPLSDAALALLPAPREDRSFLFGRGEGSFSGWSRCKERLDQRIAEASADGKGITPWTIHDLRRTVSTGMNGIGILPHVVEAILNHVSTTASGKAGVASVYNLATYADEKRDAIDRWAEHVEKLVSGGVANVVALRPASA